MMNRNPMDESLKRWLREELSGQAHAGEEAANTPDLEHILDATDQWEIPVKQSVESAWEAFEQRINTVSASEEEAQAPTLADLLHDPVLQPVLTAADSLDLPRKQDVQAVWQGLEQRITAENEQETKPEPTRVIPMRPVVRYASIAAALALLLVAYLVVRGPAETNIYASAGETKQLTLPDGSTLELNADSRARYSASSWEDSRIVKLEGEGFFKVKPGSTFMVETDQGTVSVLGTSFNVVARNQAFSVACFTGKVAVDRIKDGTQHTLTPGTFVNNTDAKTPQVFTLEKESLQPAWMKGKFTFNNASYRDVLDEVERQFDLRIEADGVAARTFTGTFYNRDILTALDAVTTPMGLVYEETARGVIVLRQASD